MTALWPVTLKDSWHCMQCFLTLRYAGFFEQELLPDGMNRRDLHTPRKSFFWQMGHFIEPSHKTLIIQFYIKGKYQNSINSILYVSCMCMYKLFTCLFECRSNNAWLTGMPITGTLTCYFSECLGQWGILHLHICIHVHAEYLIALNIQRNNKWTFQ